MDAYVLIETELTSGRDTAAAFRELPADTVTIRSIDAVTGPYEFVIRLRADDLSALSDFVSDQIHQVPGVTSTTTCIAWRR